MDTFRIFFELLTSRERRNLYLLFVAVLIMAGLEVVSVASIMPFLSVASDPSVIDKNYYLSWAFELFGFEQENNFLKMLGVSALFALVLSNAFIVVTTWALYKFAWGRNHTLSRRLLGSYLHRPYQYFLTRNSSELGKNILEEVREVVSGMLLPGLRGIAKAIVALFIVGFLVFVNPIVALMVTTVLATAYGVIYFTVRGKIATYGERRVSENSKRFKCVSEAFGGIKEVKLRGKENEFLKQYDEPSKNYAQYQTLFRVVRKTPRYILEAVAFGGIILIAVYLIGSGSNVQQVIPVLGLYAFAGYRLMPALQQAFKGFASVRFNLAALKTLHDGLKSEGSSVPTFVENNSGGSRVDALDLKERLVLDDVSYIYPGATEPAIKSLSLEVSAHSTVGFVGKTGSGKTTTVDLILGLLRPQHGTIAVDGTTINKNNVRRWKQALGYVPQEIYLSDDTVASNIAFGVPRKDIDIRAVKDAAQRAHIYDFVQDELPRGWETVVGERGVKLSGGQRQRIGIARALYHSPSVLVFDEATSALDQSTEASVMEAIYDLEGRHTILMIAHRLSTVRRADNIIMLENGEKVGEGAYSDLESHHSKFRSMALS
jgi:ATP-binding cassette subfamily C protein